MQQNSYCGIDFGTGNSAITSFSTDGMVQVATLENGSPLLPSNLFFSGEDRQTYYGRAATEEYLDGALGRFMVSPKSALGTSLIEESTMILGERKPFKDIIGVLIREIKRRGEMQLGEKTQVVMGRPVHFNDHDKERDRKAQNILGEVAKQAGFRDVEFLFEPLAAAFDYEMQVTKEETALVIDIGAGTSDFSIIKLYPNGQDKADRSTDILANAGVYIGGNDFDKEFSLKHLMPHFGSETEIKRMTGGMIPVPKAPFDNLTTWHMIHRLYDKDYIHAFRNDILALAPKQARAKLRHIADILQNQFGHSLLMDIRKAKEDLSSMSSVLGVFSTGSTDIEASLTQKNLNDSLTFRLRAIREGIAEALKQSGLSSVDTIFFTGGSTKIPFIKASLLKDFPGSKTVDGDAFSSVSKGLAVRAKKCFG